MTPDTDAILKRQRWQRFYLAKTLGVGEHLVPVTFPPLPVTVDGYWYDDDALPDAEVEIGDEAINLVWLCEAIRHLPGNQDSVSLPEATQEEYEALRTSIAKYGPQQPVIVDEVGTIISGRLRKRACTELGISCPAITIAGLTSQQKEQLAFELDHCRKNVTVEGKRRLARMLLLQSPATSDRDIGRAAGLDHKTVGKLRRGLEAGGEIPQVELRQGGDGKRYRFPRIVTFSDQEAQRAKVALQELNGTAPKKLLHLRRAEQLARLKRASERKAIRSQAPLLPDDSIQILHSDFRAVQIDEQVPLMVADPPYDRASLGLWHDLAAFAKKHLRPDGVLLAYSGLMYLPEVMAALSSELKYVWQFVLLHALHTRQPVLSRNITNKYKVVLMFSSGLDRSPAFLPDVLVGAGKEKDHHEWQQSIVEEMYFIERLTQPDDLVLSPFGGGFTTAAACYRLGRRCLSCDIDADAVERGRQRLALEMEATKSK